MHLGAALAHDDRAGVYQLAAIALDAESLCSRVGIMAQGRLVASGRVSDLIEFGIKGWELVVSNLPDDVSQRLQDRVRAITTLSHGRFAIDLAPDAHPEILIAELRASGADLVSLNPVRETLEDYFVKHVAAAEPRKM